jgi:hypothetical protein
MDCRMKTLTSPPEDRPPEIFLDTSAFLARLKGRSLKSKVDGAVALFTVIATCDYVLLEYGRVFLKEVKYFVNQLRDGTSLPDLCYHVNNNLPAKFHSKKITWLFNLMMNSYEPAEAEERTRLRLEEILVNGTDALRRYCDYVADEIGCPWASQRDDWRPPGRCHCRIVDFFTSRRPLFLQIRDACLAAPEDPTGQLRTFAQVIEEADGHPEILCDHRKCRQLADVLIAVESRSYRAFLTQNFHDSRVLCRVMGQLLVEIPQGLPAPIRYCDFRPTATP